MLRRRPTRRSRPVRGRKRYGGVRRRSYGRKRTYRKNTSMSKKRVLNITSRKKRDTMLGVTNSTSSGGAQAAFSSSPAVINGQYGGWILWNSTARDLNVNGEIGSIVEPATRTSTTCYIRGLAETMRIQSNTSIPWFYRRIVFTCKNQPAFLAFSGSTPPTNLVGSYFDGSSGLQRLIVNSNQQQNSQTANIVNQQSILFKGASGVDWTDYMVAPVDTSRVTLKSDRTYLLRSGNDSGLIREFKHWTPCNKNLVYDDDESGGKYTTSHYSTSSKAGMGDLFVLDLFQAGASATTADLLSLTINSSLYWHEK